MDQSSTTAPLLATPSRSRLVDQIVEILVDAIVGGRYVPGGTLPAERLLAEQLGVNRASLRQALSRLEQVGLVESRQGVGTVVLDPASNTDPTVLSRLVPHLGPAMIEEVLEVREGVAALVARLAAERATDPDRESLREKAAEVRDAPDARSRQHAELAWFGTLVATARNRPLTLLLRWFWEVYGGAEDTFTPAFDDPDPLVAALDRVVDAVADGRGAAAEDAMRDYASESGRLMAAAYGRAPAGGAIGHD